MSSSVSSADRNVICSFCDAEFGSAQSIADHLMMCGNKTDECPKCNRYIRRAIFAYHYENECANPDDPSPSDETPPGTPEHRKPFVTIKCPYCNQNYEKADSKQHKATCLHNPDNAVARQWRDSDENSTPRFDRSSQHKDADHDSALIPCEYCEREIHWDVYDNHIRACQAEAHRKLEHRQRRVHRDPTPATHDDTDPIPLTSITTTAATAACTFCKKITSLTGILYHQLVCVLNPRRNKN